MFVHQDPSQEPAVVAVPAASTAPLKAFQPTPRPPTPAEIRAAQLQALDEELGEARVEAYRARMKKELEEIRYRNWRDLQPEWEEVIKSTPQKGRSGSSQSTQMRGPVAGAAAVALGTAGLRMHMNELNNQDVSGDDGSGIGGFLSGLFE
jgi:hypothetical protein